MSEVTLLMKSFFVYLATHFQALCHCRYHHRPVILFSSCSHLIRREFDSYSYGQPQGYPLGKSPGCRQAVLQKVGLRKFSKSLLFQKSMRQMWCRSQIFLRLVSLKGCSVLSLSFLIIDLSSNNNKSLEYLGFLSYDESCNFLLIFQPITKHFYCRDSRLKFFLKTIKP